MLFHVSLLVLLVGLAYGKGYGYRGQAAIVEGETWANARVGYDSFSPGRFFGPERLAPFQLRLDDFTNSFHPDNTPREFASRLTALDLDGRPLQSQRVAPNRPMTVDGVRIFQSDYGYVPVVRVRDADGKELLAPQEVLTLRDPASEWSTGAVKVTRSSPQVGLDLTMFTGLVTAPDCPGGAPFCNDPRLVRPVLVVLAYQGDLQAHRAQSVFSLDRTRLEPLGDRPLLLVPGQSGKLANGMEVSFTDLKQYSVLTLARDPGVPVVAVAAALLLLGLVPSLYVTRRRVWVRAVPGRGGRRPGRAGRPRPPGQGRLRGRAGPARRAGGQGVRGLKPSPRRIGVRLTPRTAPTIGDRAMSPAELATTSDTLAWLAVLSYVVAATLFGLEFAYRVRWLGVAGLLVTVAGLAANVGAAVTRGLAVDRVPWGNMYEFSMIVGIITVAGFLVWLARRPEIRPLGVFVLLPAVLAMALGGLVFRVPAGPLVPALNSRWIVIHVAAAITGSSVLCLAAVFSILYLVKERVERRQRPPAPPLVAGAAQTADRVEVDQAVARHGSLWDRLPSADTLDHLAYRTTAFGFPIWTFAIIAGAIWAQAAWGRYWGWDPKETWSFISWTVFAAYLHARATAGWRGRRAAWLAIVGLATLLFNFYAVNTVIVGLHSYGGWTAGPTSGRPTLGFGGVTALRRPGDALMSTRAVERRRRARRCPWPTRPGRAARPGGPARPGRSWTACSTLLRAP